MKFHPLKSLRQRRKSPDLWHQPDSNSDGSAAWPNAFTHSFIHQDSFLVLWCPVSGVCHLKQLSWKAPRSPSYYSWTGFAHAELNTRRPPHLLSFIIWSTPSCLTMKFQLHVFLGDLLALVFFKPLLYVFFHLFKQNLTELQHVWGCSGWSVCKLKTKTFLIKVQYRCWWIYQNTFTIILKAQLMWLDPTVPGTSTW